MKTALSTFILLMAGCASTPQPTPDKWEFAAVRVDAFTPESMHVAPTSGPHESFDEIVGTVVSSGHFENKQMIFSRASAEPLTVGKIYAVKLYQHIGRATVAGTNPPEWVVTKEPNQPPATVFTKQD